MLRPQSAGLVLASAHLLITSAELVRTSTGLVLASAGLMRRYFAVFPAGSGGIPFATVFELVLSARKGAFPLAYL